ncbi:8-oxo-dGTP pyrophosphatase MutT (NUDIX family) [Natronocella acetinitrilica]|jgi:8-oxo-dGTP pyrophosphatase MutT (NUDIX family)|uniref:Bis(5'-nucleosyl)-tetraphosphatase [asymmetrical] n=1 Tax=Natronocella acetinitrilica TaxID=414046 RepID=A0AAE3G742_9GAMM|nr:NUDIX domain-containing protein [Natronocella acetinitrilica]MCP1676869.1 8-oxo-dGTP pyrophosphatase MutT (NUDIX family) [Natronocella acetinitrilica]
MKVRTLSAGVVIIRRVDEQWKCLLLRAFQYWDSPKGQVEAGESPFEGALREVQEETGITELNFRFGRRFVETGPYAHGKVARYYMAETRTSEVVMGINPELGRPEHAEYRWVSFDEARELASPRVKRVLDWAERRLRSAEQRRNSNRRSNRRRRPQPIAPPPADGGYS